MEVGHNIEYIQNYSILHYISFTRIETMGGTCKKVAILSGF